jgi:hypothetical protein
MKAHQDKQHPVNGDIHPHYSKVLENGNIETRRPLFGFSSDGTDTKVFDTDEKRHIPVNDPSLFPDGGLRAWSVVGASVLLVFCTFGYSPLE